MKFIGKALLTLLLLVLLILLTLYILLQTPWGASCIGRAISNNSSYQLHLSKIEHNFSSPSHLLLDDVTFGRKGQAPLLVAKQVDIGLGLIQFSTPMHFTKIHLDQGTLNINEKSAVLPLSAGTLQLTQMTVNSPTFVLPIKAEKVTGAISPWKPEAGNFVGNNANFQFSAGSLNLSGFDGTHLLVQGKMADNKLILSNVGVEFARGSLTGSAERDAQGNWNVSRLQLSRLRFQTNKNLTAFFTPFFALPSLHIRRLDVTGSSIQGPDWAVSDLNFLLKDLTLQDGNWQSNAGSLSINASSFVKQGLLLNNPIINMTFSPQGIELTQFSSRWVNGLIRAAGNWDRRAKKLTLNDLAFAGLEYTLPGNWRDIWIKQLPSWLESVEVSHFRANNNLIIDINPDFPFEMTSLAGNGHNLLLAKDRQWGIWGGTIGFNAAEATFNRVDLRHPSIALTANSSQIDVTEMSALAQNGLLEAKAILNQTLRREISLQLNGRNVPLDELINWGWPALPLQGNGNLNLDFKASLAADTTLKQSASGTLTATQGDKVINQTMSNGVINGH
ncbi:AsmA family protein [Izhakiella capsodis]|uniref:AsmA family protein n=1 Tax=Izhakiella capsodis TaxID=1367852 RepID=A0A1I5A7F8_9GAMM|nr:AsmA family protein [Izhakiella capsodis]SFN58338.1 AsmA family protein [Izhakiella capsodis]